MWIEGRAALETLERDQIVHARNVFERVVAQVPEQAPAHVGLANACAMQFEMTRTDREPDRQRAADGASCMRARPAVWTRSTARRGRRWDSCSIAPAITRMRSRRSDAPSRSKATTGDTGSACPTRAGARSGLREARRTLALLPGFPLAHWLAASVHVARQALAEAERELTAGIACTACRDRRRHALHAESRCIWLLGLIRLARRRRSRRARRISNASCRTKPAVICTRASAVRTRGTRSARSDCGAVELAEARAAFRQTLDRLPIHPMARAGLAALAAREGPPRLAPAPSRRSVTRPIPVEAVDGSRRRRRPVAGDAPAGERGAQRRAGAAAAPAGNAGWLIPIEPLLGVHLRADAWAPVLARLRTRAA